MPGPGEPIAQTNLQLYAQLRRAGWPSEEVEAAARAYTLATELLSGWYRANGKPFVDHMVGTAGVVAAAGGTVTLVRAALLHSVYSPFLRPGGSTRVTRRQRREVRAVIGVDAEDLVHAYRWFPWDDATVRDLLARATELDPREGDVVRLRLANEVDDRADLGVLHDHQDRLAVESLSELADRLEEPALAEALRRVAAEEGAADPIGRGLRRDERNPVFRVPRSHRRRLGIAIRSDARWARRQAQRVAHRLGRS